MSDVRMDETRRIKPVRMGDNEWLATLTEGGQTVWEGSVHRTQAAAESEARAQLYRTQGDSLEVKGDGLDEQRAKVREALARLDAERDWARGDANDPSPQVRYAVELYRALKDWHAVEAKVKAKFGLNDPYLLNRVMERAQWDTIENSKARK